MTSTCAEIEEPLAELMGAGLKLLARLLLAATLLLLLLLVKVVALVVVAVLAPPPVSWFLPFERPILWN